MWCVVIALAAISAEQVMDKLSLSFPLMVICLVMGVYIVKSEWNYYALYLLCNDKSNGIPKGLFSSNVNIEKRKKRKLVEFDGLIIKFDGD